MPTINKDSKTTQKSYVPGVYETIGRITDIEIKNKSDVDLTLIITFTQDKEITTANGNFKPSIKGFFNLEWDDVTHDFIPCKDLDNLINLCKATNSQIVLEREAINCDAKELMDKTIVYYSVKVPTSKYSKLSKDFDPDLNKRQKAAESLYNYYIKKADNSNTGSSDSIPSEPPF